MSTLSVPEEKLVHERTNPLKGKIYQELDEMRDQNPFIGLDEWKSAAYKAASMEFQVLCQREAELIYPTSECDHPASEWESCLALGCDLNPARDDLYESLVERYQEQAHRSIILHMVEPVGSYFGTQSCWSNAALGGVRAMADTIKATDDLLTRKDRGIEVVERDSGLYLVTDETPGGDRIFGYPVDGVDDPHLSCLGIIRRDATGWYRNVTECGGWENECQRVGYETIVDLIGVSGVEILYLCGACQVRAELDR